MSHTRLAVFDVDGTLVDSQHNIVSAMSQAWMKLGLGMPRPAKVRGIIGLSLVEACAALMPFAPHAVHRAMAEAYKEAFRAMHLLPDSMEPLFPGVHEALEALEEQGWLLGLATGKSMRGVERMLEAHGLENRFVTIQTADDNPSKPNPAMLLRAASEVGVDPADMVMIGDTSFDMMMASAARSTAIGVSWGYHTLDELREAGAQVIIDSYDNLTQVLTAMSGEQR
jgi:phosphoglycolate phosphatase